MQAESIDVGIDDAIDVAVRALVKAGVPDENARLQADLLVDAEARGLPSHGLLRLPRVIERIGNGVTDPVTRGEITWRGIALAAVDGRNGLGPVVGVRALEAISDRAQVVPG